MRISNGREGPNDFRISDDGGFIEYIDLQNFGTSVGKLPECYFVTQNGRVM
jgi:hypothetical protein